MITKTLVNLLQAAQGQLAGWQPPQGQASVASIAAQAAVFAITGTNVFLKGSVPEGQKAPYLCVEAIDKDHVRSMNGGRAGTEKGRAWVHCFAADQPSAEVLADLVGKFLDSYRGPSGNPPAPFVQGVFEDDGHNTFEPPVHGDENGNPCLSNAYVVWQNE